MSSLDIKVFLLATLFAPSAHARFCVALEMLFLRGPLFYWKKHF